MKYYLLTALPFFLFLSVSASDRDSTVSYHLPDSVRAVQFMAEITVTAITGKKETFTGIQTDIVKLYLEAEKNEREIVFEFPASATVMAMGLQVDAAEKGELEFDYNWAVNETYKLLIAVANDSAGNYSLYSGYVWLPKENKWKLIGTCKINGRWTTLQNPSVFHTTGRKNKTAITTGQVWCQRMNGSWKNMNPGTAPAPVINLLSHMDSLEQRRIEKNQIEAAINSGKTDATNTVEGVCYTLMKEGTGRQVSVNDTVVAYYKGYLFNDGLVFDQTRDKPASFPLNRLIRGWQVGLPLCKVGGKIKLVIPSDLAYSIRTRSPKIPPNSILVFEIEVVDVKPPQ